MPVGKLSPYQAEVKRGRGTAFDDKNLYIAGLSQSRQVDNEGRRVRANRYPET